ncbi:MAG: hypothetical protein KGL39_20670 [Patescibacteria group bacterium]|nr:hypothetical protein [Patescibacteria group bacterium]
MSSLATAEHMLEWLRRYGTGDQANRWTAVAYVGTLLASTPERSTARKAMQADIAECCRMTIPVQRNCLRIWCACLDANGTPRELPLGIDRSTALHLVQHGGDYATLAKASDEGWTLRDARAWSQSRTVSSDKPRRLWAHITKTVDRALRRWEGPLDDVQRADVVQQVRHALAEWAGAQNTPPAG